MAYSCQSGNSNIFNKINVAMVYFGTFIARCTLKAAIIILIECMTLVGKATGKVGAVEFNIKAPYGNLSYHSS